MTLTLNRVLILFTSLSILFVACNDDPRSTVVTLDPVVISNMQVQFKANIGVVNKSDIVEYGFAVSIQPNPERASSYYIRGQQIVGNEFTENMTGLNLGTSYHVRACVTLKNNAIIYGGDKSFVFGNLPPSIKKISPTAAHWNDTIKVSGKNFSWTQDQTSVLFGNLVSRITKFSGDTVLYCLVPNLVPPGNSTLKIKVGTQLSGGIVFLLLQPQIQSFSPVTGQFLQCVTITGSYFHPTASLNKVRFGDAVAEVIQSNTNSLQVKVPVGIKTLSSTVSVQVDSQRVSANGSFLLMTPAVSNLNPVTERMGSNITITGINLNPSPSGNEVLFENNKATVVSASPTQLVVTVPGGIYFKRNFKLKIIVAGVVSETVEFILKDAWVRKPDIPTKMYYTQGFFVMGSGYAGTGLNIQGALKDFFRFNENTNTWTKVADFGGGVRYMTSSFVIGNFAYVGAGLIDANNFNPKNDFYRYDPSNDTWTRVADFPGTLSSRGSIGFSVNGKGYLVIPNEIDNFWEYNPVNDQWTQKQTLVTGILGGWKYAVGAFVVNNRAFVIASGNTTLNELYEYDPIADQWIKKNNIDGFVGNTPPVMASSTHGYALTKTGFLEYDIQTDQWRSVDIDVHIYAREQAFFYSIGDMLYLGGGTCGACISDPKDFWECDTSKL